MNKVEFSELASFYDDSSLSWYVRYILDNSDEFKNLDSYQLETGLENFFNSFPIEKKGMSSTIKPLYKTKSFSREKYCDFIKSSEIEFDVTDIEILKDDGESVDVNIADRIEELYYYLMFFSVNKYPVYYSYSFKTLIEKFYKLSAECVFHRGNANLNNLLFRKSMTLEALYCIGKIPFFNSERKKREGYAYYNVCSPYVAESFLRTVENLECAIDDNCNDSFDRIPALKKLRTEILINKMIISFSRSTSYKQFTNYRVALNRHSSELLSIPYNELSSVQEVKPLRLFEKITSHIHLYKEESKREKDELLEVKVAVIGHAEVSYVNQNEDDSSKGYIEIFDLLRMIVDWYSRIETRNEFNSPNLSLEITYFINDGDVSEARNFDVVDNSNDKLFANGEYRDKKSGNHYGQFFVKKCSYYSEFSFSKKRLKEIIRDFGLVFVLDCPWMTTENYDIMSDGRLMSYCSYLEKRHNIKFRNFVTLDSDKNTDIQYLDAQYNRITSSDSINSGLISRVFRDDYLQTIVEFLKKSDFLCKQKNTTEIEDIKYLKQESPRKDVYVFTSEKEGVDYSYLGSYPLLRIEMYGDKKFSIAHFSNRKSESLQLLQNEANILFHIRLWSIFKYIAVSYVSVYFRKDIDAILPFLSVEDYFELLRAIVVQLELSSDLNKIVISLGFDSIIMEQLDIENKNIEKLYKHIIPIVEALYKEVVFSDEEAFGYETIRDAFEMNLYSSARDVESMLFIYLYKNKRLRKKISNFDVEFNFEKYDSFYYIQPDFKHFRDKRLYQSVFQVLERTHVFNIGTNIAFSKAKEIYDCPDSIIEKALLEKVAEACEKTKKTDTSIYKNALTALSEF